MNLIKNIHKSSTTCSRTFTNKIHCEKLISQSNNSMKSIPCYLLLVSVCKNAEIYDNLIATVGFYPSRAREGGQKQFLCFRIYYRGDRGREIKTENHFGCSGMNWNIFQMSKHKRFMSEREQFFKDTEVLSIRVESAISMVHELVPNFRASVGAFIDCRVGNEIIGN